MRPYIICCDVVDDLRDDVGIVPYKKTTCVFITQAVFYQSSSSSFSTAINASVGI